MPRFDRFGNLLRQIKYPVAGALAGFALFYLFLFEGFLLVIGQDSSRLIIEMGTTFVAAGAGGWAAFSAERRTQEDNKRNVNISAANKAIFTISLVNATFKNLELYIKDFRSDKDKDRALEMDSPQPGMLSEIKFNFDELSFFLDQPGEVDASVLMDLMGCQWRYHELLETIEHRAKAREDLHKEMKQRPIGNLSQVGIAKAYPGEYRKLDATTTEMVEGVDAGLKSAKEIYQKLRMTLNLIFPEQDFLKVASLEINSQQNLDPHPSPGSKDST